MQQCCTGVLKFCGLLVDQCQSERPCVSHVVRKWKCRTCRAQQKPGSVVLLTEIQYVWATWSHGHDFQLWRAHKLFTAALNMFNTKIKWQLQHCAACVSHTAQDCPPQFTSGVRVPLSKQINSRFAFCDMLHKICSLNKRKHWRSKKTQCKHLTLHSEVITH